METNQKDYALQHRLCKCFNKYVVQVIQYYEQILDEEQIAGQLVKTLLSRRIIKPETILGILSEYIKSFHVETLRDKVQVEIATKKSYIGKILSESGELSHISDNETYKQLLIKSKCVAEQQGPDTLVNLFIRHLFSTGYKQIFISGIQQQKLGSDKRQQLYNYAKQFSKIQQNLNESNRINIKKHFDIEKIRNKLEVNSTNTQNIKDNLLQNLYQLTKENFPHIKYKLYMIIHQLQHNDSQSIFNQLADMQPEHLQNLIFNSYFKYEELILKMHLNQYIEDTVIHFQKISEEQFLKIDDDGFKSLFNNISSRVQLVKSKQLHFFIIYDVVEKRIHKGILDQYYDVTNINNFCKYADGKLYNIIICGQDYKCIGNIRIKYLSYYCTCPFKLELKYPQDIEVASLHSLSILNLHECTNLKGLKLQRTNLMRSELLGLKRVQIISLYDIKYEDKVPLLSALFEEPHLQYVNLEQITGQVAGHISKNLRNLRYLYYENNMSQYSKERKLNTQSIQCQTVALNPQFFIQDLQPVLPQSHDTYRIDNSDNLQIVNDENTLLLSSKIQITQSSNIKSPKLGFSNQPQSQISIETNNQEQNQTDQLNNVNLAQDNINKDIIISQNNSNQIKSINFTEQISQQYFSDTNDSITDYNYPQRIQQQKHPSQSITIDISEAYPKYLRLLYIYKTSIKDVIKSKYDSYVQCLQEQLQPLSK